MAAVKVPGDELVIEGVVAAQIDQQKEFTPEDFMSSALIGHGERVVKIRVVSGDVITGQRVAPIARPGWPGQGHVAPSLVVNDRGIDSRRNRVADCPGQGALVLPDVELVAIAKLLA